MAQLLDVELTSPVVEMTALPLRSQFKRLEVYDAASRFEPPILPAESERLDLIEGFWQPADGFE